MSYTKKSTHAANILIIENDPAIRQLLAISLQRSGYRVLYAHDGAAAARLINESPPEMVLLDWTLFGGMSGVQFARSLRCNERTREVSIIMLTDRTEERDKVTALDAGADDYILKPFSVAELGARIRAVLRRRAPHRTNQPVSILGLRLDPETYRVTANSNEVDIGQTEFQVLHFLMTHSERTYSRSQILNHVWGDQMHFCDRSIDVHICRLRNALEASGHDALIQTVRNVGYRISTRALRSTLSHPHGEDFDMSELMRCLTNPKHMALEA